MPTIQTPQPTPGPWRVYQERAHYYSIGTDYARDRGHDQNIVRDVRKEANAVLMAAAPEMLEALETLMTILKNTPLPTAVEGYVWAGIRKARGGNLWRLRSTRPASTEEERAVARDLEALRPKLVNLTDHERIHVLAFLCGYYKHDRHFVETLKKAMGKL